MSDAQAHSARHLPHHVTRRKVTDTVEQQIGSKLHTIYTMKVQKRGLVLYDDKRILLPNLPDVQPNLDTHAFVHYSLEAVQIPIPEQQPPR